MRSVDSVEVAVMAGLAVTLAGLDIGKRTKMKTKFPFIVF